MLWAHQQRDAEQLDTAGFLMIYYGTVCARDS
jgi:hypothetical protein